MESGAEGGTRTPTSVSPLDPEPSASANSATSARGKPMLGAGTADCQGRPAIKDLPRAAPGHVDLKPGARVLVLHTLRIDPGADRVVQGLKRSVLEPLPFQRLVEQVMEQAVVGIGAQRSLQEPLGGTLVPLELARDGEVHR